MTARPTSPDSRPRRIPLSGRGSTGTGLEDRTARTAGLPLAADDSAPPDEGPEARLLVAEATVLDLLAHELRRDGRPIPLRPKEYQLLATLAANPGRAFSRRQLLDLAWDRDRDIDTRTVDVHVHWLRAKIEASPRHPTHLITVRGFGYRLDPWPNGSR
jgi:DNA-binding response OmpR family regulator